MLKKKPKNSLYSGQILFSTLLVIIIFINSWNIYSQLNNKLINNKKWQVTKQNLEMNDLEAIAYINELSTLAYNKLNLGNHHGFQEIISSEKYNIKYLDFDFKLSQNSYLFLILNKNEENFDAIRISQNTLFPSEFVKAKDNGYFIHQNNINLASPTVDTWHHLRLRVENELVTFKIDDQNEINLATTQLSEFQKFGFRGSYNPVIIDNIKVTDSSNHVVMNEKFNYQPDYFSYKIIAGLLIIITILVIRSVKTPNNYFHFIILLNLTIISTFSYLYVYNFYTKTNSFPIIDKIKIQLKLEQPDNEENWWLHANNLIFSNIEDNNLSKIFFLGSSQTWGIGAKKYSDRYVTLYNKYVEENYPGKYQIINAGINGSDSSIALKYYKNYWSKFNPKIVYIDLSNNDGNEDIFRDNITEIVNINREKKIKTVLLLEANSPEAKPHVEKFHNILKSIAIQYNLQIIDIHNYLHAQNNTGIIWWDEVHPTSYGHQLIGKYVFDNSAKLLE